MFPRAGRAGWIEERAANAARDRLGRIEAGSSSAGVGVMGNGASLASNNMKEFVLKEFERVRDEPERDYLVLPEMMRLRSVEQLPIDFADLGMLFCLDANHDGMVTLPELNAFMLLCSRKSREYKAHEFQSRMAAYAAEELWRVGIRAGAAGNPTSGTAGGAQNNQKHSTLVAWVAALVHHCNNTDLDLSTSLDASIDFAAMAAAAEKPQPAPAQPRSHSPGPANEVDELDVEDDVDEASEELLESPPARKPALSIPRLNLGGAMGGRDAVAVKPLSLAGVALKGGSPAPVEMIGEPAGCSPIQDPVPAAPALPVVPGELVGMDTVKLLFDLLHVADVAEIGFQEFVDLLQQVAEEAGTLDLEDESFDNVVPMDVVTQFVRDFAGVLDDWMVGYTGDNTEDKVEND